MSIHPTSVIKAGGVAALIGFILSILATIPFQHTIGVGAGPDPIGLVLGLSGAIPSLGCLLVPLLCVGFTLFPMGAGLGYCYLVQGNGNLTLGAALAGAFGGFVYGSASGLVSLVIKAGAAAFLQDVEIVAKSGSSSLIGVVISLFIAVVIGLIFGAIGSALWPTFQRRRS